MRGLRGVCAFFQAEDGIRDIGLTGVQTCALPILRSLLRQDPDVIMIGEIRDSETAELAIKAALTGHLVFSSIHAKNSIQCIDRLCNLGISPFLIANSLLMILSQRLLDRKSTRLNSSHANISYAVFCLK